MATHAAEPAIAAPRAFPSAEPPEVPLPKPVQTARFIFRPLPFFEHWRRELGETFRARLFGPGEVVFLSDPESIKRLFTADRVNTIAPGRNIILEPLLGSSSLLLQTDGEHLRRRKLMLPPFHGERMRGYEGVIREVTERTVAGWPREREFALHPSMQAITLEVILRAVFGVEDAGRREDLRASLVEVLAATASPAAVGFAAPGIRRLPPFRRIASLAGARRRAALRRDRRAPPPPGPRRARRHPLDAARRPLRRRLARWTTASSATS